MLIIMKPVEGLGNLSDDWPSSRILLGQSNFLEKLKTYGEVIDKVKPS